MRALVLNLPDPDGQNVIKDLYNGAWCRGARIGGTAFPPLPLLYALSVLKPLVQECSFIDAVQEGRTLASLIPDLALVDLLVCHSSEYTISDDLQGLATFKQARPSLRVFLFGNVLKGTAQGAVQTGVVDAFCLQDPEEILPAWVGELRSKPAEQIVLDGLVTRNNPTPNPAKPVDLDRLPIPDRLPLLGRSYPNLMARSKNWTTMLTSRGCLFRCAFCNTPGYYAGTYRMRSIEQVTEELHDLAELGYREIFFRDDLFRAGRLEEFCDAVMALPFPLSFVVNLRTELLTEKRIHIMAQAGCHTMKFGVESGDDTLLKRLDKPSTAQVLETFALCRRYGIKTHAHFMIGLPGETKEQMQRTLRFLETLDPFTFSLGQFTPHPGSRLYEELSAKQTLPQGPWKEALSGNVSAVSDEELRSLLQQAYLRFYGNPRRWWRIAREVGKPLALANAGRRLLQQRLRRGP